MRLFAAVRESGVERCDFLSGFFGEPGELFFRLFELRGELRAGLVCGVPFVGDGRKLLPVILQLAVQIIEAAVERFFFPAERRDLFAGLVERFLEFPAVGLDSSCEILVLI